MAIKVKGGSGGGKSNGGGPNKPNNKGKLTGKGKTYRTLTGDDLRDMGIKQVLDNNPDWHHKSFAFVIKYLQGQKLTGEQMRYKVRAYTGNPKHPNGWGALTNQLKTQGYLIDLNRWGSNEDDRKLEKCQDKRAHSHMTRKWLITLPGKYKLGDPIP